MSHASHRLVSFRLRLDVISPNCSNLPHQVTLVPAQVGAWEPAAPSPGMRGSEHLHRGAVCALWVSAFLELLFSVTGYAPGVGRGGMEVSGGRQGRLLDYGCLESWENTVQ